jgi:threonine dehydrogenase-like Zn-dependent dehydrogenase
LDGGLLGKTCRAAVLFGPEDLRIENIPVPLIGPEEVLVQVKTCALCGSDLHAYLGKHPRIVFPRILGHEFAGVIVKKGEKVLGWEIGQRVCCDIDLPCGQCDPCRQGRRNLCVNLKTQGFNSDGAYCELVKVPQNNLYLLPDSVSFDEASMIQTLAIAYNGVKRRGEVTVQDQVLIFGCGPIGLCALAVAKAAGAKVSVVDTLDYRLEAARTMGADQIFNAAKGDLVKSILEWTRGKGVDKVIEAVGGEQDVTLSQASQVVKRAGLIVVIGTFSANRATLRMAEFKDRELEMRGARGYVNAFPDCIDLVASGKLRLDRMITHRLRLEEVKKGLNLMKEKTGSVLKVIINP